MANIIQQTEEYFLKGILDIIDLGPIGEYCKMNTSQLRFVNDYRWAGTRFIMIHILAKIENEWFIRLLSLIKETKDFCGCMIRLHLIN